MPELALALSIAYALVGFVLRIVVQLRRTGSTGFHGVGGRPGSVEWLAGVGFSLSLVIGATAPVLALLDVVEPIEALDSSAAHVVGAVLAIGGIAGTFAAQLAMGASWRIGVDHAERTDLVTDGPFSIVRNPIYSATIPTALGLTLLVPSWVALLGLAMLVVSLEVQVRVIEEPYLRQVHGSAYTDYERRVGRFVPRFGR